MDNIFDKENAVLVITETLCGDQLREVKGHVTYFSTHQYNEVNTHVTYVSDHYYNEMSNHVICINLYNNYI